MHTMVCPPLCRDNQRGFASGLSHLHVENPRYNYLYQPTFNLVYTLRIMCSLHAFKNDNCGINQYIEGNSMLATLYWVED